MPAKRVLSVGQCLADHTAISWTLRQHFDVEVVPADTADETFALLRQEDFDLVLVNRLLDADGSSGVKLIEQLKAKEGIPDVPVMLVSNYEDAQQQAVRAGAMPGFGKGALGHAPMLARVEAILKSSECGAS